VAANGGENDDDLRLRADTMIPEICVRRALSQSELVTIQHEYVQITMSPS
jgi:hypothetical protein